ncbi:unnamed protein product [Acanthoscelides obtectus]|uniref:Fanconi-associated nuclease n=2 Tax=Acanthoscelides obtectus TaxID=200917 RepID=A0A9P0PDM6_ACAOB|nr:unnamed protein product [Acanthoscelides obtectus]CAK1665326.1 Fanconi-associated nuclease 1 [Acanthoscelides obtectus]
MSKRRANPSNEKLSQTSIEQSIQNLKILSRKQMEMKLIPGTIINMSDDTEYTENFSRKSHSELGVKKFFLPFNLDSDEDSNITFSDNTPTVSPKVTPVKPAAYIGVHKPVACSTPHIAVDPNVSSNLQQSDVGGDTNETTIIYESSTIAKSVIHVIDERTIVSPRTSNNADESRIMRTDFGQQMSFSPQRTHTIQKKSCGGTSDVPSSISPQKVEHVEKKGTEGKRKNPVANKSGTKASSSPQLAGVDNLAGHSNESGAQKKRAPRRKQNGSENGGSPRKFTKTYQIPGKTIDKNGPVNVAYLADCLYGTNTSSTVSMTNKAGSKDKNCSASKKGKIDAKEQVIKLRDQLISIGKLPPMCTTMTMPELQALIDENTSSNFTSHNHTNAADVSVKPSSDSLKEIIIASKRLQNANKPEVAKNLFADPGRNTSSGVAKIPLAPSSTSNSTTSSLKSTPKATGALTEKDAAYTVLTKSIKDTSSSDYSATKTAVVMNQASTLPGKAFGLPSGVTVTVVKRKRLVASSITANSTSGTGQNSIETTDAVANALASTPTKSSTKQTGSKPNSTTKRNVDSASDIAESDRSSKNTTTKPSFTTDAFGSNIGNPTSEQCMRTQTKSTPTYSNSTSGPYVAAGPQNLSIRTQTKCSAANSNVSTAQARSSASDSCMRTPTKRTNRSPERSPKKSPRKMSMSPRSPKKQSKFPTRHLELIKEKIYKAVKESRHAKDLVENELNMVGKFFELREKYQFVCLKLLTWQWKWYNVHKFCRKIEVDMNYNETTCMYEFLKDEGYVDTDYDKRENVLFLLNTLDRVDIRDICDAFKLNGKNKKKKEMIALLRKYGNTQCTLTSKKTSSDLLLEKVKDKMGAAIKMNDGFRKAFYRLYTLATFSNIAFANISDFFNKILHNGVAIPEYDVSETLVFWGPSEFDSYVDALEDRKYLEEHCLSKKHVDVLARCEHVFERLKKLSVQDEDHQRYEEIPHLKRYTAKSVYISCLTKGCEFLRPTFPEDVTVWLEYLIEKFSTSHNLGKWYNNLCCIYMSKEKNYKKASKLILEAFKERSSYLTEVQKFLLSERAESLKSSVKYKVDQLDHDELAKYVPVPKYDFTEDRIDARTIRENESGRKRHYVVQDADGSSTYMTVEDIALQYYKNECGYTDGGHFEGGIVMALFNLLFWDIIYNPKQPVPASFISTLQYVPLDIYTTYFYQNRQKEIDSRIRKIRSSWSYFDLLKFARSKYTKHSHENSMCVIQNYISDPRQLDDLILCIGRNLLAGIFERLVKDIKQYKSGFPDLTVWNVKEQKCKFVEVKGEGDKLSAGQNLWINYLKTIGANVAVCVVHSIGSKRRKLKGSIKQSKSMLQEESVNLGGSSAAP